MKLKEYLQLTGISKAEFARRIGITSRTVYHLLDEKKEPHLSLAIKIEEYTNGKVTCRELLPKNGDKEKNKKTVEKTDNVLDQSSSQRARKERDRKK